MTAIEVVGLVADLAYLASTVGVIAFTLLYGLRSHWRATTPGRVVLGFMVTVGAIMVSAIVFELWGDHETEQTIVRAILWLLLLGGIIHLIVELRRAQRCDRHVRRHGKRLMRDG